jgi:hypothetical protein
MARRPEALHQERQLKLQRVIVPKIGDGNPGAASSLERAAAVAGVETQTTYLSVIARIAQVLHGHMSGDPCRQREYTEKSEAVRTGLAAQIFSKLMFGELVLRVANNRQPSELNAIQEHQLLEADRRLLEWLGILLVRLVVVDTQPKLSGEAAVQHLLDQKVAAELMVWNEEAYKYLDALKFPVKLVAPFLLSGFWPEAEGSREGDEVVIKASGSGMPKEWMARLQRVLPQMSNQSSFIYPGHMFSGQSESTIRVASADRHENFYRRLGSNTRVIIASPSEIVQVVAEMRSRGINCVLIALPPRGEHEKKNLEYAIQHGLVAACLEFDDGRPTVTSVPVITPEELPRFFKSADLSRTVTKPPGLGKEPYWEAVKRQQKMALAQSGQ